MTSFTLRLDDSLNRELDQICENEGYTKTGLIKNLVKNYKIHLN